jgi:hypothetical protein
MQTHYERLVRQHIHYKIAERKTIEIFKEYDGV